LNSCIPCDGASEVHSTREPGDPQQRQWLVGLSAPARIPLHGCGQLPPR
jgi:hypothetical protein